MISKKWLVLAIVTLISSSSAFAYNCTNGSRTVYLNIDGGSVSTNLCGFDNRTPINPSAGELSCSPGEEYFTINGSTLTDYERGGPTTVYNCS
jgi:hypothetical protein